MSAKVIIDHISIEKRKKLIDDLNIKTIVVQKNKKYLSDDIFDVYDIIDDNIVSIPFAYYYQNLNGYPNQDLVQNYQNMNCEFQLNLFERQKQIRNDTLSILNETRSIVLSLFTGFGKTYYAIYLACKINLKTVIFCHRVIIMDQWEQSIKKACGDTVKIQIVTSKCKIDHDADFYIINVVNMTKRDRNDFSHCGLLIADELHTLCTEKYSKALTYIFPKYSIGLTATPVRSDGKDRVIELFMGPNIITKTLTTLFNVYLINTGFVPISKTTESGQLNWNSVLESQSISKQRNELIIDIARYFSTRNILILCKRKDHAKIIAEGLKMYNEDVDVYMGSTRIVNYNCRILVATYSKSGCGFDHPALDMLILAADAQELFQQYLGRVFRREYHFPIIIDPQDKFFPLRKHSETRIKIYKETGGEIRNFEKYFPHFSDWRHQVFKTDISQVYKELNIEL